jgi:glucokinase
MRATDGSGTMARTLTVDIGGTKCSVAITDDDVQGLIEWPTVGSIENLERVTSYYQEHLANGGDPAVVVAVCFGGPVDFHSSTVKRSVHVSGWEDFNFSVWASETFGLPAAVDNDAKVGALAEFHHGGHNSRDLVYVTLSTGVGAGVISDGRLLRGADNEAGELGHTRVRDDLRQCSCGRTGCLERLCSGYWIEQDHGKSAVELFRDDSFVADYAETLARGLSNAILLYNPSVIVLGGGISRVGTRLTERVADSLASELASWRHLIPTITTSRYDREGVHRGAKELTRDLL